MSKILNTPGDGVSNILHTPGHKDCPACATSRRTEIIAVSAKMPFAEAAPLWLHSREFQGTNPRCRFLKARTLRDLEQYLRALARFFGELPLREIHSGHLISYQQLRAEGALGPSAAERARWHLPDEARPVGPNKINQELGVLRLVLKKAGCWTAELEERYTPFAYEESDVNRALTPREQLIWLETAASRPEWRLIHHYSVLSIQSTCSHCEMRGLQIGDVNLLQRTMMVRKPNAKNRYRIRTVALSPDACASADWLMQRAKDLPPAHEQRLTDALFPLAVARNHYDFEHPMSVSGLKKLWNQVRTAARVEVTPHELRHTGLTRLAEAGTPIHVMLAQAGHMTERMQRHYITISEQAQRLAVESAFGRRPPESSRDGVRRVRSAG